jgi:hypothetical protein
MRLGAAESRGYCYRFPPVRHPSGQTLPQPETSEKYKACGEFKALEVGEVPAVKEKVNPPQRGDRKK